jgi:hypothetical protein
MTIDMMTTFFMWCTLLNGAVLLLTGCICVLAEKEWLYGIHHRLFGISRESFNAMIDLFIAMYKIIWITFNMVPYLALLVMKHLY